MKVRAGDVLNGKYEVERRLAKGGMGSIWIARDRKLCRRVAVKFIEIAPRNAADAAAIHARFEREALAVARLNTAHAVHIYDHGLDSQTPYIVMEYLEGEDLRQVLARVGRLSLSVAADLMGQAALGLRAAHEAGIVHRDLKPGNIFLADVDHQQIVKILDFGVAKLLDHRSVTVDGEVFGSAKYMSPEQIVGAKDLDLRSDLWSMGVILYRAITGTDPFGGDVVDAMRSIRHGRFAPATSKWPDLAPEVDGFFARALAFDKQRRFLSAVEMAEAFAEVADKQDATTTKVKIGPKQPTAPEVEAAALGESATPQSRSGDQATTRRESFASIPEHLDATPPSKDDRGGAAAPLDHETLSATASDGSRPKWSRSRFSVVAFAAIALAAAGVALRPRLAPALRDVRSPAAAESDIAGSTAVPSASPDLDGVEIVARPDPETAEPLSSAAGAASPPSDAEPPPQLSASAPAASPRGSATARPGAWVSVPRNPY